MTPERMDWSEDERLYQPRIHSRRIRALHRLREEMREPMTMLVDRALGEFIYSRGPQGTNSRAAIVPSENTTLDASPSGVERPEVRD